MLKPCIWLSFVVVLVCILFGCLRAWFMLFFYFFWFSGNVQKHSISIFFHRYLPTFPFRNEYFTGILHSLNHCMPAEQFYKLSSFWNQWELNIYSAATGMWKCIKFSDHNFHNPFVFISLIEKNLNWLWL